MIAHEKTEKSARMTRTIPIDHFVSRNASRVLFEPVPGITLQRPATVCTASEITRSCSSCESVGDSPVVPTGTTQVTPAASWNSICCRSTA